jgi:hypothetical protein
VFENVKDCVSPEADPKAPITEVDVVPRKADSLADVIVARIVDPLPDSLEVNELVTPPPK